MSRGGVYVPPHQRQQQPPSVAVPAVVTPAAAPDDEARQFQQDMWSALNRSLLAVVNKATITNLQQVSVEALRENLVRGRGLFCKALIRAQSHHVDLSNVFAALVAVVNSKVPAVGHLLGRRLIANFKRFLRRQDSHSVVVTARFITHLCMQRVMPTLVLLKVLATLLCGPSPNDFDIETAVAIFRDSFKFLEADNAAAFRFILEPVRELLSRSDASKTLSVKSRAILEKSLELVGQWQLKKEKQGFMDSALDLVDDDDQILHDDLDLDEDYDIEAALDVFRFDPDFDEQEADYETFAVEVLGDAAMVAGPDGQGGEGTEDVVDFDALDRDDELEVAPAASVVVGASSSSTALSQRTAAERNGPGLPKALDAPVPVSQVLSPEQVSTLRKELFLILKSSMRGEEVAHKILTQVASGHEAIVAKMLLEASYHETSFDRMYGIVATCLCSTAARYQMAFDRLFVSTYAEVEALTMKEIDISGKFFGYLLVKNVLHWHLLKCISLVMEDTNESNRNFIRVLFQYLGEEMSVAKLGEKLARELPVVNKLFPRDTLEHARFAINFFGALNRRTADLSQLAVPLAQWYEGEMAKRKRSRPEDAL